MDRNGRLWEQHDGDSVCHVIGHHSACGDGSTDYELMADAMDCSADIISNPGMPEYSDNCGAVDCWGAAACTFGMKILNGRTLARPTTLWLRVPAS